MNTPRTNQKELEQEGNFDVAWEDFARQLETENQQLAAELERVNHELEIHAVQYKEALQAWQQQRDQLAAKVNQMHDALKLALSLYDKFDLESESPLSRPILSQALSQSPAESLSFVTEPLQDKISTLKIELAKHDAHNALL